MKKIINKEKEVNINTGNKENMYLIEKIEQWVMIKINMMFKNNQ